MSRIGIYVLLCNNERYYIGSTNNLERGLFEHRAGSVMSTKYVLPVKLMFFQNCDDIIQARKLEYQLKKKKSKIIIEKIIKDGYIRGH